MISTRAARGGVQTVGDGVEIAIEEARADVERHCRAGVTEHPLDGLDASAGRHGEARRVFGARVGEIAEAGWPQCGIKEAVTPVAQHDHAAAGAVKTRSSGDSRTQAVARASTKERGTGTERQQWDFGVPNTITPSTSVTARSSTAA